MTLHLDDYLPIWLGPDQPHGTSARYQAGCKCDRCRLDHQLTKWDSKNQNEGRGMDIERRPAGDWADDGACRNVDPELFYPSDGYGSKRSTAYAQAKAVCATCPQQATCLEHAITQDERWGVWGGKTPIERARLAAGTRRQCPECLDVFAPTHGNRRHCISCRPSTRHTAT